MKTLIVPVNAGAGHITAMQSLLLSLQRFAPEVNVAHFTSPNRALEHLHRLAYTKGAYLYNAFYKATHTVQHCARRLWGDVPQHTVFLQRIGTSPGRV